MFSVGNVAHPVGLTARPLADNNVSGALVKNLSLFGWVCQPAANCNGCLACFQFLKKPIKLPLLFTVGCHSVTPNQITQQNSLQRAGDPKGSKGETLRPDSQANT
jgi:hypothetical protein